MIISLFLGQLSYYHFSTSVCLKLQKTKVNLYLREWILGNCCKTKFSNVYGLFRSFISTYLNRSVQWVYQYITLCQMTVGLLCVQMQISAKKVMPMMNIAVIVKVDFLLSFSLSEHKIITLTNLHRLQETIFLFIYM